MDWPDNSNDDDDDDGDGGGGGDGDGDGVCIMYVYVVGECDSSAANEDLHTSLNQLCMSMIGAALDSGISDPLWWV